MLHAQESRLSPDHRASTLTARLWRGRVAYLLVLPTFLFLALFFYYPAWIALSRAFTDWDGFNPPQFVGLANFSRALSDPVMGLAARNNLLWAVTGLFVSVVPPFLVAELLISLRSNRGQYLYRSAFVAPLVVPLVVSLLVWTYFYHNDGVVNQALQFAGLGKLARAWLVSGSTAMGALLFMGFPWVYPFNLLVFYAGLQGVSSEIYDAAKLDGALGLQRIWRIDLPLLTPQFRLITILAVIGSTQKLLEPLLMTNGGPGYSTTVPILHMYKQATQFGQFGYSMALSFLLFLVTFGVTGLSNLFRRGEQ